MTTVAPRKSMEPWIRDDVNYYPHQIEGIRDLASRRSFILADEMGLGKSLQALTVFAIDIVRGYCTTAIVVCPVSLKGNWSDEIEKFTGIRYMNFGTVPHPKRKNKWMNLGPAKREAQLAEFAEWTGPKILVTNYEQIKPHVDQLNKIGFDVVIADEAHYLKNHTAARTKAFMKLRSLRSFLLTGTPMLNHVNELWVLLNRIDPKQFPSYWSFVKRYCVFGGYKEKQIVGVKNEKELREKLQSVMLRRLKKDVLNLKEPHIVPVRVDLTDAQQKLYDEVNDELRLTTVNEEEPADIENALTKFLRLKQICGTTYPFTGVDDSNKLDRAVEICQELLDNGNKVVVMTQFRDVLECFAKRIDKVAPEYDVWELHGGIDKQERQPIVKEWSEHPNPAVIACMIQVAGVGLNMTAAKHMIFLDKLFVPGLNKQAIDRIHRIGQDESQPVQVIEMITRGTVEGRVEAILKTKVALNDDIVEMSDFKRKLMAALMEDLNEEDDE